MKDLRTVLPVLLFLLPSIVTASKDSEQKSVDSKAAIELTDFSMANTSLMDNSLIADLTKKIEALNREVTRLSLLQRNTGVSESELNFIRRDIEILKAENQDLRNQLEIKTRNLSSNGDLGFVTMASSDVISLPGGNVPAEAPSYNPNLQIFGFFDADFKIQSSNDDETDFSLGFIEINVRKNITDRVFSRVLVDYKSSAGVFGVGPVELGINLHSNANSFVSSADLIVGKFDVRFGSYYRVGTAPDRRLVSIPLAVALTHNRWGDYGFVFEFKSKSGNLAVYGVNGFASSAEVTQSIINLQTGLPEDVTTVVNTTPANAFGARLGINASSNIELGTSLAAGLNQSNKSEMTLVGADMTISLPNVEVKGEYISHSLNRSIAKETNKGYYVQSAFFFDRSFISGRYGSFKPDGQAKIGQFSVGGGLTLFENVDLRFESIFNDKSDNNRSTFQVITKF